MLINGVIIGDVHATERVPLAKNARTHGSVYYHFIEMEMGAGLNGAMVHMDGHSQGRVSLGYEPPATHVLGGSSSARLLESADGGEHVREPSESECSRISSSWQS